MTLIEPRVPSALPAFHLLALLLALAWATRERRYRPPPRGAWRLAWWAAGAAALADVVLLLSVWSGGVATLFLTVAFILGLALLALSLLQGWPSRPILVLAALAIVAPFLLWLG